MRLAVPLTYWLGGRLAMAGARLNFLTQIHVRASHYRLSAGSAMRDRPPAGAHDTSIRSACDFLPPGAAQPEPRGAGGSREAVQRGIKGTLSAEPIAHTPELPDVTTTQGIDLPRE